MVGIISNIFNKILRRSASPVLPQRHHVRFENQPDLIYAIGDVHGRFDLLQKLEKMITADAKNYAGKDKLIVMLGDYVDRGPQSAQVLDHLIAAPPEGFVRTCLAGNHEQVMLNFLSAPSETENWLKFGGVETLGSYGIPPEQIYASKFASRKFTQLLKAHIPDEHIQFLTNLPSMVGMQKYLFVHAGIRPGVEVDKQLDQDLMWIRGDFLKHDWAGDRTIVHGHTPQNQPEQINGRVNIDTGAYASERLTAARIVGNNITFLFTS